MSTPRSTIRIARLTLHADHANVQKSDPLSWGVPVARGRLKQFGAMAIRDVKRPEVLIAVQADVTARWPDGSAKWLFVTALNAGAMLLNHGNAQEQPARAPTRITVELCKVDVPPSVPDSPALKIVATGPGMLSVDTGTLRFEVSPTGVIVPRFDALSNGHWHTLATGLDLITTIERDGVYNDYTASNDVRQVTVESIGPLRACIAIKGTHRDAHGRSFGPYVLRMVVLAGMSRVMITHSLVFDGDPAHDFLRASNVRLNTRVGEKTRFAFGGDAGRESRFVRQFEPFLADWRCAELFQDSISHWRLQRRVEPTLPGVFCDEGNQSDGWSQIAGSRGSVTLAIREFAQNHPKSLEADGAGTLTAGLYPRRAERLDLRRYSPLIYVMSYEAPCTWKHETLPFPADCGAQGTRKTHDLFLAFNEANPSASVDAFNRPLRLSWPPAYTTKTGFVVPAAKKSDPRWKKIAEGYVEFLRDSLVRGGASGYLNYFDLPLGFNLLEQRWFHEHGGLAYINNEALPCLGLFQAYLLTGSRDALTLALAMARHNADSDTHYLGPRQAMGSRHNVSHAGDACKEPRISQPVDKRLGYFLAGDTSCLEVTALLLEHFRQPVGKDRWINVVSELPSLLSTCIFSTDIGTVSEDAWLKRIADVLAESIDEHGRMNASLIINHANRSATVAPGGKMNFNMFSCFGAAQLIPELAERYDHQKLRDALVRLGRYQMLPRQRRMELEPEAGDNVNWDSQVVFRALDLLAYCYHVTGDRAFADYVVSRTKTPCVSIVNVNESRYGDAAAGQRTVPMERAWPEDDGRFKALAAKYRPAPGTDTGQTFNMAVYLHKLQGLMVLAEAATQKTEPKADPVE